MISCSDLGWRRRRRRRGLHGQTGPSNPFNKAIADKAAGTYQVYDVTNGQEKEDNKLDLTEQEADELVNELINDFP